MNAELEPLNVPMIHKIFKDQISEGKPLLFIRHPNTNGYANGVKPALVEVENTTVAFQRLAKHHCYDPNEIHDGDGTPLIYSKEENA